MTEKTLPLFVLEEAVLLPGAVARLETHAEGIALARSLLASGKRQVVVALRKGDGDELKVHDVGVLARLEDASDEGIVVSGHERVRITRVADGPANAEADFEVLTLPPAEGAEVQALALEAKKLSREILALLPGIPREVSQAVDQIRDPHALADMLAFRVPGKLAEKQRALETLDATQRLTLVVSMLARRREILKVASDIDGKVQATVGKAERDHMLRKRMEAIQHELDAGEESPEDADEALDKKIRALGLPEEVLGQVTKELARLRKLPENSPERGVSRGWLQWISDLPWSTQTQDNLDVENARATLDADHQGLKKIKDRVLQFLAVRSLRGDMKGPLLCLVGPPGVGKTSLGQSVARAMGRKFVRVSLGGVRDEAEIRGHRRTYVGALPGRIVQALKRAGSNNPVIMLDEIDKLGAGYQGDPSAALLEVLDPEQNKAFADHYLEVPFDLSKVLFIATANTLDTVPAPLRDRMEVLSLAGYTTREKVAIAQAHLVPKQLAAHGLDAAEVSVTPPALERLVQGHTREAGVRALERRIAALLRAVSVEKAAGKLVTPRVLDAAQVELLLGPDRFDDELPRSTGEAGIANGLAWTPVGGDVLTIETLRMPGKGQLILSGQLGSVMQESAKAALSYLSANAEALGLPPRPLDGHDLHIHVPAGGTPKDGPSAGVTLFTALASQLSGIPVRSDTAMTGEATLRGKVLAVGGIKEKVLAAHRLGLKRVILPADCAPQLRDIPEEVRAQLEIIQVKRMDEALDAALVRPLSRPAPVPVFARAA